MPGDGHERYAARRADYEAERIALNRKAMLLSNVRLLLFVGLVAGLIAGLWDLDEPKTLWLVGAGLCLLGFIAAAAVHALVLEARTRAEDWVALCDQALARMERRFEDLPDWPPPDGMDERDEELAVDLDLFGPKGLIKLFGVQAADGARLAGRWLLSGVEPESVIARQAAVDELSARWDLRAEYGHRSRRVEDDPSCRPAVLADWAEAPLWLRPRPGLRWSARVTTFASLLLIVLQIAGVLSLHLWLLPVLVSVVLGFVFSGPMQQSFAALARGRRCFGAQAGRLEVLAGAALESQRFKDLQQGLRGAGRDAPRALRALDRLLAFAELRLSTLAHAPLQAVLLWDFHLLDAMESWKARHGMRVRAWLSALAEFEAFCGLAALKDEQADWGWARLDAKVDRLKAEGLRHPLLPPQQAVANDVELGPAGSFLLVTGSNMSGKSTLLRAIGSNVLLAQAGAPVAARSLVFPPLRLGTSFRIRDSVADGVSFFLAELKRLKSVVDRAEQAEGPPLCYLFDEILLGTNVFERQVAVQRVVGHLVRAGALGAVATHDLSLADAPGLQQACRPVHFREQFEEGEDGARMRFDYKLRPGVTPTTNALKLLELVGLPAKDLLVR